MTTWLLAGGGTAGHVNPLLAVADTIRRRAPEDTVLVLGTQEGLESRLVPARGYELVVIPRLPFPRRPNGAALRFAPAFQRTVAAVTETITARGVERVVGFGGYAAAPGYLAARRARVPLALHEANAKPGIANRLGSRLTAAVGVAFPGTPLRGAQVVGMPLRREIETLDRAASRAEALEYFGLDPERPVLLVTGGSLGARRINATVVGSAAALLAAGWSVLHIVGGKSEVSDPNLPHYRMLDYCDRMELALSAADAAVSRAGAATVSELTALGIAAVYVPYPVGNGEQRFNARGVIDAGGGVIVDDAAFLPGWVDSTLVPLLADRPRIAAMARAAESVGVLDGADRMTDLAQSARVG
ncbi:UDP-N-acetylglucosamine--N-acetylmuramyl-(pentapeptide) pyrophosphoryl-undecaprenol N-acetylglucosamine transferase [Naasia lichenicola]|uniref:UDP-N-acetylglucosamine--N-acetylmuramyl-(pentapeptide) pyrophosphoryl-undecaprenol N-acetylglucosamine transferase n=1 Tax=Naasia lichenicola TaxID=2565933 RepID=A0A4S4FT15_9MICO|nr:UDP-N-acetylglucosamine--N-acetylmuramyl-(pentapeptide) pyrophosphoryl-undecaprenol N-acetylglucosamine transferase [Naasia lichenicola]THG33461.1 UDP-N-acetylglucosamine--N-acetylmuramyl-(pentapeptide) pyrophosphoryl-undecaprenol N-acetylglucosamine transferase [Naasia lichenicola]